MSEDTAAAPAEGIDLSGIVETDTAAEPAPEPTPAAAEPAKESMAAIDLFAAEIAKYPSPQEAKKHYKEISERIGCSSQLGYKATKKAIKNGAWNGLVNAPKPKTPTIKIERQEPEPREEPECIAPEPEQDSTGTPTYQQQFRQIPEYTAPSFSTPTIAPDVDAQQKNVIASQATKALNNVLDIVGAKMGAAGEKGEAFLDAEDSEALGVVIPILIKKVTNGQAMTPELQENAVLISFAGNIVSKGIKNRFKNVPVEKPIKTEPPQPAQEKPAPAPTPAAVTAAPPPADKQTNTGIFTDHQPAYKRELR